MAMKTPLLLICVCAAITAFAQPPNVADTSQWKPVFADEFNGNRLNRRKWDILFPWNQPPTDSACLCDCDGANPLKELRAYPIIQNDTHNIKVQGGTVKLFVRKEKHRAEYWHWEKAINGSDSLIKTFRETDFTSGMLYSRRRFYRGYFEIKFKLPPAPTIFSTYAALGPNFWLYEGNCWNEIDGFEIINGQQRTFTSNLHYELPPTMVGADTTCDPLYAASPRHQQEHVNIGSITDDEWHIAAFDWQADSVIFYLDGKEYYRNKRVNVTELKPMNMIVNISAPIPGNCVALNSLFMKYPYVFEVDYIRVWERK